MSITFREKSLWLLLVSLCAAFGIYFAFALPNASPQVKPTEIAAFIGIIVVLVVVQIIGHALLGIASRRELAANIQTDERDAWVRLKGTQLGSYVLAVGVFFSLCVGVFVRGNFAFVHVLLAFWVLAQATEYATQLVLYRRS
ncbi:hypothetical protein [Lysobacter sp. A421]